MKNLKTMGGLYKVITILFITLTTSLTVLAQDDLAIIRDVSLHATDSLLAPDEKVLFRQIAPLMDLKNAEDGINLRFVRCGAHRIPESKVATLPVFDWSTPSSDRRKHLAKFIKEGLAGAKYLNTLSATEMQTNMYRTLAFTCEQMKNSKGKKTIIFYTDGVPNSSAFSAQPYVRNPRNVLTDYDKIVEAFESDMPIPDLKDFSITFIVPGDQEIVLWFGRFWSKYLQSKGAVTQIKNAL